MFIGYPRSSHSLVAAILDAHPEIIIPNEYNVIKSWNKYRPSTARKTKMSKYRLFYALHQRSREQALFGKRSNGGKTGYYNYNVPGLWQGGYQSRIKVRTSIKRLSSYPPSFGLFVKTFGGAFRRIIHMRAAYIITIGKVYIIVKLIKCIIFFQAGTVTNPAIWLVLSAVRIFLSLTTVTVTLAWVFFFLWVFFHLRAWKKINKLFTGLGSVRIVKNCDLGLENAALGLRPRAAFSESSVSIFHYTDLQSSK